MEEAEPVKIAHLRLSQRFWLSKFVMGPENIHFNTMGDSDVPSVRNTLNRGKQFGNFFPGISYYVSLPGKVS